LQQLFGKNTRLQQRGTTGIFEEYSEIRRTTAIKHKTTLDEGISKTGRMALECRNSF